MKSIYAEHGINTREYAIVYIDGDVLIGENHPRLIQEWLEKHTNMEKIITDFCRQQGDSKEDIEYAINEYVQTGNIPEDLFEYLGEYNRQKVNLNNIPYAFAHMTRSLDGKEIFIDTEFLSNVDLDTVVSAISNKYPDIPIFSDNNNDVLYVPDNMSKNKDDYIHLQQYIIIVRSSFSGYNKNLEDILNEDIQDALIREIPDAYTYNVEVDTHEHSITWDIYLETNESNYRNIQTMVGEGIDRLVKKLDISGVRLVADSYVYDCDINRNYI